MSEDQILPPYLRVHEIFSFFGECYRDWDTAMAERLRKQFGLDAKRKLKQMSKGEQRQVGLICAVAHNPELLVLDEPAGGLDVVVRRAFLEVVIGLLHERGATVFYSSHQLSDVERISNRVALLHKGKLKVEGELDHLHESHCRVMLPEEIAGGTAAIEALPGCISVNHAAGSYQAVFTTGLEQARTLTAPLLKDPAQFQALPLNLEEIFIALVGGDLNHDRLD
jgi:ABC-2 type transport system ATP-binding protein